MADISLSQNAIRQIHTVIIALMVSFLAITASAQDASPQKTAHGSTPAPQTPQAANPDNMLQQFSDYETKSAVLSDPRFYSEPIVDSDLFNITQNGTAPAVSVEASTLNFDTSDTEDTQMSYHELQALKDKFRPVDVNQKKSKIVRYKPEFSIRTNNDTIEIK